MEVVGLRLPWLLSQASSLPAFPTFGLWELPDRPGSPYYKQNAFDLVAFGFWGLPGRPGPPYYKQNAFDLAAFGCWGLPGRLGLPYYM